jgi:acid phosphatase
VLASLGTFEGEPWPPYTSHIALELFKKSELEQSQVPAKRNVEEITPVKLSGDLKTSKGWFGRIFGGFVGEEKGSTYHPIGIARQKVEDLNQSDRSKLEGYFVRIRYNDKVMTIPGCQQAGKHLDGDESFCTLVRQMP